MTVIKEASGTYTVRCWFKDWRGQRKQKVKRGFEKLKEAKQWEREFQLTEQNQVLDMTMLIAAFVKNLDTKQATGKLKITTCLTKKRNIKNHIELYFKGTTTENITPEVVNEWIVHVTKSRKSGKPISSATINIIRNLLSQIFKYGKKHYNLKYNPVEESESPKQFKRDTRATHWEVEEYEKFYNFLPSETLRTFFNILYWGGLRMGEALALTADDIKTNTIIVNKTLVYATSSNPYADTPKTLNSYREVYIADFLYKQIVKYMESIDNLKKTDRIFPFTRNVPYYWIKVKAKKLGLPIASPHTMRHSYITNMLSVNEDFAVAAAQAGDTPLTIFRNYAHVRKQSIKNSVDKLAKLREK